jgi:hypothetical protein
MPFTRELATEYEVLAATAFFLLANSRLPQGSPNYQVITIRFPSLYFLRSIGAKDIESRTPASLVTASLLHYAFPYDAKYLEFTKFCFEALSVGPESLGVTSIRLLLEMCDSAPSKMSRLRAP